MLRNCSFLGFIDAASLPLRSRSLFGWQSRKQALRSRQDGAIMAAKQYLRNTNDSYLPQRGFVLADVQIFFSTRSHM
ncbi:hypothetical protein NDU88_002744 [Pleurodeles waltl]|uniref:Uncharacterized protein n=1 Tax=Pleurodeles waltl TaxID=8319 RepID=A0AAV7Q9R6_PLEWA|nr:hypothetical protein NDU88_002744 [Pleurodeles waltl]